MLQQLHFPVGTRKALFFYKMLPDQTFVLDVTRTGSVDVREVEPCYSVFTRTERQRLSTTHGASKWGRYRF